MSHVCDIWEKPTYCVLLLYFNRFLLCIYFKCKVFWGATYTHHIYRRKFLIETLIIYSKKMYETSIRKVIINTYTTNKMFFMLILFEQQLYHFHLHKKNLHKEKKNLVVEWTSCTLNEWCKLLIFLRISSLMLISIANKWFVTSIFNFLTT